MKEIQENEKKIREIENKIEILEENKMDFKLFAKFAYSIIPWILINASFFLLPNTINSIQVRLLTALSIMAPVTIGDLIYKKQFANLSNKTKKITNAKTQDEIIEEQIKNEISKEKLLIENKIIEKTIEKDNNKILSNKSPEELTKELKEKYQEMEVILTQKVLREQCQIDKIELFMLPIISMIEAVGLYYIPAVIVYMMGSSFHLTDLDGLIPVVIGSSLGLGYVLKRNHDYKKAFKRINTELKENSINLNETEKNKEQEKLYNEMQLEYLIDKISNIKLDLANIENSEDKILIQDKTTEYTLELNQSLEKEPKVKKRTKKI